MPLQTIQKHPVKKSIQMIQGLPTIGSGTDGPLGPTVLFFIISISSASAYQYISIGASVASAHQQYKCSISTSTASVHLQHRRTNSISASSASAYHQHQRISASTASVHQQHQHHQHHQQHQDHQHIYSISASEHSGLKNQESVGINLESCEKVVITSWIHGNRQIKVDNKKITLSF